MSDPNSQRVRRIRVAEEQATGMHHDYADEFELSLSDADDLSPEQWLRAGIDNTPEWIKRISGHQDGLGSAAIIESSTAVFVVRDSDTLMETTMIARNVAPTRRTLTTVLVYKRPILTAIVWSLVSPLHRYAAKRVIQGGVATNRRGTQASRDH